MLRKVLIVFSVLCVCLAWADEPVAPAAGGVTEEDCRKLVQALKVEIELQKAEVKKRSQKIPELAKSLEATSQRYRQEASPELKAEIKAYLDESNHISKTITNDSAKKEFQNALDALYSLRIGRMVRDLEKNDGALFLKFKDHPVLALSSQDGGRSGYCKIREGKALYCYDASLDLESGTNVLFTLDLLSGKIDGLGSDKEQLEAAQFIYSGGGSPYYQTSPYGMTPSYGYSNYYLLATQAIESLESGAMLPEACQTMWKKEAPVKSVTPTEQATPKNPQIIQACREMIDIHEQQIASLKKKAEQVDKNINAALPKAREHAEKIVANYSGKLGPDRLKELVAEFSQSYQQLAESPELSESDRKEFINFLIQSKLGEISNEVGRYFNTSGSNHPFGYQVKHSYEPATFSYGDSSCKTRDGKVLVCFKCNQLVNPENPDAKCDLGFSLDLNTGDMFGLENLEDQNRYQRQEHSESYPSMPNTAIPGANPYVGQIKALETGASLPQICQTLWREDRERSQEHTEKASSATHTDDSRAQE